MEDKINALLLVNKDCDFAYKLRKHLIDYNFEVSYVNDFNELINRIILLKSCVLFFNKDTIQDFMLLSKFNNTDLLNKCITVYVDVTSEDVKEYLKNTNFYYCPTSQITSNIQNIINQFKLVEHSNRYSLKVDKISAFINDYLTKLGFTQKWIGFKFIRESLIVCIQNNFYMGSLIIDVYPHVAVNNNTSASNVERSIRNAITKAYNITHFKNSGFEEFTSGLRKITNRIFLACILEKINSEVDFKQFDVA